MSKLTYLTNYYTAMAQQYSAAYEAYRDRVVAAGGTISSSQKSQQILDCLANHADYNFVQWLDSRAGISPSHWYSPIGPAADAVKSAYGAAMNGIDSILNSRVIVNGAYHAGSTPELATSDSYTWGMRYYRASTGNDGFFWGNRYGSDSGWNSLERTLWQSYAYGDNKVISLALPQDVWQWVWCVKSGAIVRIFDQANAQLGQVVLYSPIVALPLGIGGGTDSTGISTGLRYQSFIRCASALTAAQRAIIQAI